MPSGGGMWFACIRMVLLWVMVLDIQYRRIPNGLSVLMGAVGLGFWGTHAGWQGLAFAWSGMVSGALVWGAGYAMGWIGAADVKVGAAVGALVGPQQAVQTALYGWVWAGAMGLGLIGVGVLGSRAPDARRPGKSDADPTNVWITPSLQNTPRQGPTVPLAAALSVSTLWYLMGLQWGGLG